MGGSVSWAVNEGLNSKGWSESIEVSTVREHLEESLKFEDVP